MSQTDLETLIRQYAAPLVADLGLEIWGIELLGGHRPAVRLFVEVPAETAAPEAPASAPDAVPALNLAKRAPSAQASQGPNGVDIEDCAEISRRLGLALEVDEVFVDAWTLEVSSPGFERPFFAAAQLKPYVGREIEATLAAPLADWPGRKKFRGTLQAVAGDVATLAIDATQRRPDEPELVELPWSYVRKSHLIHIFEEPVKPGKSASLDKNESARPNKPSADKKFVGKKSAAAGDSERSGVSASSAKSGQSGPAGPAGSDKGRARKPDKRRQHISPELD